MYSATLAFRIGDIKPETFYDRAVGGLLAYLLSCPLIVPESVNLSSLMRTLSRGRMRYIALHYLASIL